MKKRLSLFLKYFMIFGFFLFLFSVLCSDLTLYDFIWNYGFSHAIRMGEIPYLDFNMISTPLYSFLMAFLLLFWDNYLMFFIGQAALCTVLAGVLFKYIGKKGWFLLLILAFPLFKTFIGTYNFLALLIVVTLFLAEDSHKNDYFIGILLGFLIFTKQTIGGVVLVTNLLFLKDIRRIGKRLLGVSVPSLIFLIYFIVTKSLWSFIDLCFLGLFDFGTSNGNLFSIWGIVSIILVVMIFIRYFKTHDIKCSYALGSFLFAFPLFDFYHFSMFLMIYILLFIKKIKFNDIYIRNVSLGLLGVVLIFNILLRIDIYKELDILGVDRFNYYLVNKNEKKKILELLEKYREKNNSIIVGDQAMMIDIASEKRISYFDVTLKGNYGYNGTDKMISKIESLEDFYFFVDTKKLDLAKDSTQLDYKLINTIREKYKLVDSFSDYEIYHKE